jgi:hypothetical protein
VAKYIVRCKKQITDIMNWKIENLKPAAIAWPVTMALLLMATVYSYTTENRFGDAGIIFFASLVAYFTAYLILRKK